MQKSLLFLTIALVFAFGCQPNVPPVDKQDIILNAADYGLTEGADGTSAIIRALEDAKIQGARKLLIPRGTYFFTPQRALERYMAVSNNDNSLKRMVFALIGFEDFEIDGQGSTLLFEGKVVPFCIEQSRNLTIRNLTIDWKTPLYGQATVIASKPGQGYFDIHIDNETPYELHKGTLYVETGKGLVNTGRNLFFHPNKGGTVYRVNDYKLDTWNPWHADAYTAEELGAGQIRIRVQLPPEKKANYRYPETGWKWVFKGAGKKISRLVPTFRLYRSFNLTFEDINMHHSSGIGMIGEKCGDVTIERMTVKAAPGTDRAISTTADATHFVNCKGMITVKDSYFAHMLDDAINVHGIYTKIEKIDGRVIGVRQIHHQQHGNDFAEAGDTLAIADNKNLETVGTYVVQAVKWFNSAYQEVTLDRAVEDNIALDYGVENVSWNAGLTFVNNTVEKNRARGIIFSTRGKVLIEGNTFSNMMAAISISSDNNYWFESGPVTDVTIRGNRFINCTTGNKGNQVIQIMPMVVKPETAKGFFNGRIAITGNTFEAFDKGILFALSIEQLSFTDNVITHSDLYPPLYPERPTIEISRVGETLIQSNTFNAFHPGSIVIDAQSAEHLTQAGNHQQTGNVIIKEAAEGANKVL